MRYLAALAVLALCLPVSSAAWTRPASITEVVRWLSMRDDVYAKCLTKRDVESDPIILTGASAYVSGTYDTHGRWRPNNHTVIAPPLCHDFLALQRGRAEGRNAHDLAFAVLVVTHESGHLRDWDRASLDSESESSTERWALRHFYAVARRIGLTHDAAIFLLGYAVKVHRLLPPSYKAGNCKWPRVEGGRLVNCGAPVP